MSISMDVYSEQKEQQLPFPDLEKQLQNLRKKRGFVPEEWSKKKAAMLNDYMRKNALKACVLSLSGGVDSACTLALLKLAQKLPNSPIEEVLAIAQPIGSTPGIQNRAYALAKALDTKIITVDQTESHKKLSGLVKDTVQEVYPHFNFKDSKFADAQLRSYLRTPVAYYVAQLLSSQNKPCIVMGTGNLDEDGYLLYFCKAGDGVVDVQLIADIHKNEVYHVAKYLGVPHSILGAPPSADLWEGQTDEGELGFSYNFVELYTQYLQLSDDEKTKFKKELSKEALEYFEKVGSEAQKIHNRNAHKISYPKNLNVYHHKL